MKNNRFPIPAPAPIPVPGKQRIEHVPLINGDVLEHHFDDRGRRVVTQTMRNHQIHGMAWEFYPGTDQIRIEKTFDSGHKHGPMTHFRKDGTRSLQKNYVAGVSEGDEVTYHPDGITPKTRTPFVAGINTGCNENYYASGALAELIPVVKGKNHGRKQTFYADGKPKSVEEFDNGTAVGTAYHLHPNGIVANRVVFENGEIKTEDGLHANGQRAFHRAYGAKQVYGRNRAVGLQLAWNENGRLTERNLANGLDGHKDLLAAQKELAEALVDEGTITAAPPPVFKPQ